MAKDKFPTLDVPPATQEDAYGAQLLADLCHVDRGQGMTTLLPVVTAARLWAEGQIRVVPTDAG